MAIVNIKKIEIETEFFNLYQLSQSCYAAIAKPSSITGSNSGFIELERSVVVFDTFLNLDAAHDLKRAIIKITGKDTFIVINSHEHTDHYIGNQAFSSTIISSHKTGIKILENSKSFTEELNDFGPDPITEREMMLRNETDEDKIIQIKNTLLFLKNLIRDDLRITPPTLLISNKLSFQDSQRVVELESYHAHTDGDLVAYVVDEKVCFTGDILFSLEDPYIGDQSGNPQNNLDLLKKWVESDYEYFVPGHGPLAGKEEVKLQIQYMEEIMELVQSAIHKDDEGREFKKTELSEVFHNWDSPCFPWNIDFLKGYLKKEA